MTLNSVMPMVRVLQSISVNKFIYYFKRIPLIGKMLPDSAYSFGDIKIAVTIIATIFKAVKQLAYKSVYIGVMACLPALMFAPSGDKAACFVTIMAFLSVFGGLFNSDVMLRNSFEKYTCIKLMRMSSRNYLLAFCMVYQATTFLAFLLPMVFFGALVGVHIAKSILLTLMIVMAHTIGETLNVILFTKAKMDLAQNVYAMAIIFAVAGACAYGPLYFAIQQTPVWSGAVGVISGVVLSLPFVIGEIILFVLSLLYLRSYKKYTWLASRTISAEGLASLQNPSKAAGAARFRDVSLNVQLDFTNSIESPKLASKKGYEYLNALFFERHKRMLIRPVQMILLVISGLTVVAVLATIVFPMQVGQITAKITQTLPAFVFIMYIITTFSSEKACRAMFNNCDISLLRYSFYREPKDILQNFGIRFKMICKMNMIISVSLCLMVAIIAAVAGSTWSILDEALFMLSIIGLGLFFSVHHLFLYYVFQPYTTDLGMKNPVFSALNTAVYILSFMCLQIDSTPKSFTTIVLCATLIYTTIALILVRKFAPQNFRVK